MTTVRSLPEPQRLGNRGRVNGVRRVHAMFCRGPAAPWRSPHIDSATSPTNLASRHDLDDSDAVPWLRMGTSIARRYVVLGPIGHGGLSVVYEAVDTFAGRKVAVKIPAHQFLANP